MKRVKHSQRRCENLRSPRCTSKGAQQREIKGKSQQLKTKRPTSKEQGQNAKRTRAREREGAAARGVGREARGARPQQPHKAIAAAKTRLQKPGCQYRIGKPRATEAPIGYRSLHLPNTKTRLQKPGCQYRIGKPRATEAPIGYRSLHLSKTKQGYRSQDANIELVDHGLQKPPLAVIAPISQIPQGHRGPQLNRTVERARYSQKPPKREVR